MVGSVGFIPRSYRVAYLPAPKEMNADPCLHTAAIRGAIAEMIGREAPAETKTTTLIMYGHQPSGNPRTSRLTSASLNVTGERWEGHHYLSTFHPTFQDRVIAFLKTPEQSGPRYHLSGGMVLGMATTKITITVPDSQLTEIKNRVRANEAASISGFIQRAVQKSLENEAEYPSMIEEGLAATGGPLTAKERAWARKMLTPQKRGSRARKVA